jgi:hypothetical protein
MGREYSDEFKRDKVISDGWHKIDKRETELRNRWWGGEADPKVLDAWIDTTIELYQYQLHHNRFNPLRREAQAEEWGERILYFQKLARGSYAHEKANYCLEVAQGWKKDGEEAEARLQQPPGSWRTEEDIDLDQRLVAASRKLAANCLRMAANCLTMPDTKPETTQGEE